MKWTRFLMAMLCLIFLMTSACSTLPKQTQLQDFYAVQEGDTVKMDGQCTSDDGARKVAEQKVENKKLRLLVKEEPSFLERLQRDWLIFSVGAGVGVGGYILLF